MYFFYSSSPILDACFSLVEPTPVQNPVLVAASLPALSLIDIDEKQVERDEFVQYFR